MINEPYIRGCSMYFFFRGCLIVNDMMYGPIPEHTQISPSIHVWGIVWIRVNRFHKVNEGHYVRKDVDPPPAGINIPGDELFMKKDKPDWILQILFHFL